MKTIFLSAFIGLLTVGCSDTTNPRLTNPQILAGRQANVGGKASEVQNPKAEILFVIDNSVSMESHIANVSKNIDKFVDSFVGKSSLEFNIAVTSVYDTRCFDLGNCADEFAGREHIRANGEFYPVTDKDGKVEKHFLSSTDEDLKSKLKKLLKVKAQGLEEGGPQVEELLSPLKAIYLDSKKAHPTQNGFFKGPDAYKIIVFISDASDNSKFDVKALYDQLLTRVSGREKLMAFGAFFTDVDVHNSRSSAAETACKKNPDPGVKNNRVEQFLDLAKPTFAAENANKVHLCNDNFGSALAKFGDLIRQQTQSYSITLSNEPNLRNANSEDTEKGIWVTYGEQRFIFGEDYTYDPSTQTIHIKPEAIKDYAQGARFRVDYTPIIPTDTVNEITPERVTEWSKGSDETSSDKDKEKS